MAKKAKREDFDPILFQGIAHRGLHDENKTENGLNAFKAALENGYAIRVGLTDQETIGIDTPEDMEKALRFLRSRS